MLRLRALIAAACIAICLPDGATGADDTYFPLRSDSQWNYVSDPPYDGVVTISGVRQVAGKEVIIRRLSLHDRDGEQEYENYWSITADGTTLLHGFTQHTGGFSLAYDPPIPYLPADPPIGSSWSAVSRAYDNLDATGDPLWEYLFEFRIPSGELMQVPAGSFETIRVEYRSLDPPIALRLADGSCYDITGLRKSATRIITTEASQDDWGLYIADLAKGVGEIRFEAVGYFLLSSYSLPVPTLTTTWSRIRAQRRGASR